ncbi:MAG: hypothetical protein HDR03_12225 [Lachnospiraceae bacterium]|nr:hypothetical protein [Lachnospiraceae bacterium]
MGKLASKTTKRIMASLLTIAMIMSNMTVYASEYSEPAAQTDEAVENTETGAIELPSTNDETVQDDVAQDETADDKTSQEGTEGDAQDPDASDENSDPGNDVEGGDASEPEKDGEEVQAPEETDADIQEAEAGLEAAEVSENNDTPTPRAAHTMWLVGDSTVCSFNDNYYYPRYGYGTQIGNYLDSTYTVNNLAMSGRSSKSFLSEANYTTLKNGITSGDVLVIGFGHNDEKDAQDRYTNPNDDYQTEGSFAKSLYDNYVKIAQDAGAEVILCTPIVRRNKSGDKLTDSQCHITADKTTNGVDYPGGDYAKAIRDLGTAVNVPVVDLTALTKTLYEEIGASGTLKLHAWTSSKETSADDTHLNIYGAKTVAWMFANAVKNINGLELASHIDLSAGEPTEAADLQSNPDYKESAYAPPTTDSTICKDYVIGEGNDAVHFKGTAFGDLGGNPSSSNHILGTDSNGNMHIQVKNNKGKIAASADGIAMYYYQVPAGVHFTFSAKATLTDIDTNDQVAFGLMARDDMYIDKNEAVASDYVVAGSLGKGSNCYYRQSGKLGGQGTLKNPLQKGKDYDLSIVYNGDGFACTFGDETPQSGGYDFQLTSVDPEYVYIGMFVARNADVTFSNIYLEVDGNPVVDERKESHNITVTSDDNGTAETNNAKASEGSTVVLSATPNDGYMFKEWQITSNGETTTSVDNQYTMPANDIEIKAVFEPLITEWNFETDSTLTGETNGILREGTGKNTTFYAKGLLVDATKGKWDSTGTDGWAVASKDTTIVIPVEKRAYVDVEVYALTKDYTVDYINEATVANGSQVFTCDAVNGEILLEITGPDNTAAGSEDAVNKIKYIKVTPNDNYTPPQPKNNIQVWDFGGKVEEDTDLYTNNITPGLIRKLGIVAEGGSYKSEGPTAFGDLEMNYVGGDRFYSNIPSLSAYNAGSYSPAQKTYSDGYASAGAWYGNGAGSAKQRTVTINNVKAGDKIVAYMGNHHDAGECEFTFAYGGDAEDTTKKQTETVSVSTRDFNKFEFIAKYDGSYDIYQSGGTGKIMYHRIMKLPVVTVSGTIDDSDAAVTLPNEYSVRFYNETTKTYTDAEVNTAEKTFTAKLTPGYTYRAILNATGLGFTNESKNVTVEESDCETGTIDGVTLVVKEASTYTYSGTIVGFADGYDISDLDMAMVPDESFPDASEEPLEVDKTDLTFSVLLEPDVTYTIQMEGACDYEVTAPTSVNNDGTGDYTNKTITVDLKPKYEVTGNFIGLGNSASVTKLTLTNVDDDYPYDATVNSDGEGYTIELRDGTYLASAEVTGYSTKTHVIVNGKAVTRDLMFVSTASKGSITYAEDIYVGYPDKANNYATVSEAVEACELMNRTAGQRVKIHIAPGTYREQIIVTAPNVSFVNDTNKEVLLTWYYGIGYKYYSADSSGYYNSENAYDQYDKNHPSRWGVAVYIKNTATAFRAEGITFENSFNRYITDEELDDGVELVNDYSVSNSNIAVERNYNTDVNSKAATERAAAIAVEADQSEFLNCAFYSSQDTLYTQGAHLYFKNCIIEGQTDYIYGRGNCVFDACELSWKGYSANSQGGYITANQPSSGENGYWFRNCTVTANNHPYDNKKLTVVDGYFGRPWGADASVVFMNTKLQDASLITSAGWDSMGSNPKNLPEDANFKEYNTTTIAGASVSTSGRVAGTVIDAAAAAAITVADYFGGWTPYYYVEEDAEVAFTTKPFITSNGDLNTPYPGNTLTVGYSLGDKNDANDASLIQWYSVKDNQETLVKTYNATVDKTYKIQSSDTGAYIKVVVTPTTVSGTTGTAEACTLENTVGDGYEDPDQSGGSANLGDGVNIFLVGDSTVKDYSATGINSGGTARNEGAWGEFLQTYFDSSNVTIVNYANGGRSSRNFINEGSLDTVAGQISEGDYMFIQFGHNDSSDGESYIDDRYVPLGTPVDGVYPTTAGTKVATPTALSGKGYGDTCYTYDCGGTFKWYLLQYINVAKKAGAIPVLVTPVSRMYYDSDGNISPHHDSSATSDNAYVTAVKQLANEQDVLLIDGFELTKTLFEDAWEACDGNTYGTQIMHTNDKTHNNKLGGMIEAAAIASAIQDLKVNISYAVKAPAQVLGMTTDAKTVFTVNNSNVLTAFDINSDYTEHADYWETIGQAMINAIKEKAAELNPDTPDTPDDPNKPDDDEGDITIDDKGGIEIVGLAETYYYTGAAITPDFSVVDNSIKESSGARVLALGTDYTVKYKDNKKENSTATVTVVGKGNYAGKEVTGSFKIEAAKTATVEDVQLLDLKGAKIEKIAAEDYTGNKITPNFKLKLKGEATAVEYEYVDGRYVKKVAETAPQADEAESARVANVNVAISNNINKGTATILVTGKTGSNNKVTSVKATFKINAIDLSKAGDKLTVKFAEEEEGKDFSAPYAVKGATPKVTVSYKFEGAETATVLKAGRDYTVKYSANKKADAAGKVVITGKGNYAKKAPAKTFTVGKLDMKDTELVAASAYEGVKAAKIKAVVVDANGDALKASQYTVKVYTDDEGKTDYTADKLSKGEKIYIQAVAKDTKNLVPDSKTTKLLEVTVGANIASAKVKLNVKSKAYTGTYVELNGDDLQVTMKNVSGDLKMKPADEKDVKEDEKYDYEIVSYSNNINKGTATAVIKGIGDYSGTKTIKFKIAAKEMKKQTTTTP